MQQQHTQVRLEVAILSLDAHERRIATRFSNLGFNGAEAVAQLKAICPRTVCIGVTGNAGHDCAEAQQLMAAGCLDIWGKPMPQPEVIKRLLFGSPAST